MRDSVWSRRRAFDIHVGGKNSARCAYRVVGMGSRDHREETKSCAIDHSAKVGLAWRIVDAFRNQGVRTRI